MIQITACKEGLLSAWVMSDVPSLLDLLSACSWQACSCNLATSLPCNIIRTCVWQDIYIRLAWHLYKGISGLKIRFYIYDALTLNDGLKRSAPLHIQRLQKLCCWHLQSWLTWEQLQMIQWLGVCCQEGNIVQRSFSLPEARGIPEPDSGVRSSCDPMQTVGSSLHSCDGAFVSAGTHLLIIHPNRLSPKGISQLFQMWLWQLFSDNCFMSPEAKSTNLKMRKAVVILASLSSFLRCLFVDWVATTLSQSMSEIIQRLRGPPHE